MHRELNLTTPTVTGSKRDSEVWAVLQAWLGASSLAHCQAAGPWSHGGWRHGTKPEKNTSDRRRDWLAAPVSVTGGPARAPGAAGLVTPSRLRRSQCPSRPRPPHWQTRNPGSTSSWTNGRLPPLGSSPVQSTAAADRGPGPAPGPGAAVRVY